MNDRGTGERPTDGTEKAKGDASRFRKGVHSPQHGVTVHPRARLRLPRWTARSLRSELQNAMFLSPLRERT